MTRNDGTQPVRSPLVTAQTAGKSQLSRLRATFRTLILVGMLPVAGMAIAACASLDGASESRACVTGHGGGGLQMHARSFCEE